MYENSVGEIQNNNSKKVNKKIIAAIIAVVICVFMVFLITILNSGTYVVKFDVNGGTTINKQKLKKGQKIVKPSDPKKEGYEFDGWYFEGEKFDFDLEVTENVDLYAVWIKKEPVKKVKVSFDTDGGSKISSVSVEVGKKIEQPTNPTKEGYVFIEWLLNNAPFNFDSEIVSNITLVASWKKLDEDSVTVLFDSRGGSNVATQTIKKGEKVVVPGDPTRNGYTFDGWYMDNKKFDFNNGVNENITLVARWTKKVVTQSGSSQPPASQTPPTPSTPSTPAVTKYTVTFNSNGGSSVSSQTIAAGSKITKPSDPVRSGHKFVGWTLNGNLYNFNTPVNSNITLVAKWEVIPAPDVYTVVAKRVDNISTGRILHVYKNGREVTVKNIKYNNGVTICSGTSPNTDYYALEGETSLKLELQDGTNVTATLTIE